MGLIICELNLTNRLMYESLFVEMGCVLKFSHLISAKNHFESQLRDALHELEIHNKHLNNLSQTDDLTGLFNRRGFLNAAGKSLTTALNRNASGILIYADLDGLKSINDTYGHEEGDFALIAASNLLKKTFRSSDIIARLGGDEFTVLTVDTSLDSVDAISRRLACFVDEFNSRQDKKPYQISISFGAVAFPQKGKTTIEALLAEADRCLYRQKREKFRNDKN
jgi:diguanylate cyclase (GGDEF)-like protein